ncbi:phenylacetate-CoA oxygenase subunit PaaJ [Rossellomorea vietnamensis]|uniref:Phenylacetate-CoA oxygenase subunit PaaJ n=1 Tax=Rossellomorea vietnamensis TaxID=218284 RepID=A0A5D4NLE7_9BACI|nr:1,2-phenylacetyl-CoA epoxidase subunit PaaD [Rossellomorea vietnamensis]TYS14544.1 phenylacetate-CoA oxygenase subunit PaaJ [Rossellomorea vietnamensis]
MIQLTEKDERILNILQQVKDPEIDSVSIVELGMVEQAEMNEGKAVIKLLPTFMGCPALEIIKANVEKALLADADITMTDVDFLFSPPWTSDRVSEAGRGKLKEFGIAPPPERLDDDGGWKVDCPYCNSPYTTMENIFGPTACRSILYCKQCKNPFEAMKPISTIM